MVLFQFLSCICLFLLYFNYLNNFYILIVYFYIFDFNLYRMINLSQKIIMSYIVVTFLMNLSMRFDSDGQFYVYNLITSK